MTGGSQTIKQVLIRDRGIDFEVIDGAGVVHHGDTLEKAILRSLGLYPSDANAESFGASRWLTGLLERT